MVTVNGLKCGVKFNITAGGTLNGDLVGPRSFHRAVIPCPSIVLLDSDSEPISGNYIIYFNLYIRICKDSQ